jgi:hypothetical protein
MHAIGWVDTQVFCTLMDLKDVPKNVGLELETNTPSAHPGAPATVPVPGAPVGTAPVSNGQVSTVTVSIGPISTAPSMAPSIVTVTIGQSSTPPNATSLVPIVGSNSSQTWPSQTTIAPISAAPTLPPSNATSLVPSMVTSVHVNSTTFGYWQAQTGIPPLKPDQWPSEPTSVTPLTPKQWAPSTAAANPASPSSTSKRAVPDSQILQQRDGSRTVRRRRGMASFG